MDLGPLKKIFRKPAKTFEQKIEIEDLSSILLKEESRAFLVGKLADYKTRLDPSIAPEAQLDEVYKIAIVEDLLRTGSVDTVALSKKMTEEHSLFNKTLFDNACRVIKNYIEDGGRSVLRGSGLPKTNEQK